MKENLIFYRVFICRLYIFFFVGYWFLYNVFYFEKVYNMSGYFEVVVKMGIDFFY